MRDVNSGWFLRYTHANVASFFFLFLYFHTARGLYYSSYKTPRVLLWSIGVIILILTMAIAFLGYKNSPKWLDVASFLWNLKVFSGRRLGFIITAEGWYWFCFFSSIAKQLLILNSCACVLISSLPLYNLVGCFNRGSLRGSSGIPVRNACPFALNNLNSRNIAGVVSRLKTIIKELDLNPVYVFENLNLEQTKQEILKKTRGLSGIYMILNKVNKNYYIGSASTNRFYSRFTNHLFFFRGALGSGISHLCLQLSKYGNLLKLLLPSYSRKAISGWISYSGTVIIQKICENKMDNRVSKSIAADLPIHYSVIVKEQRVDGSYFIPTSKGLKLRCTLKGFERNYQVRVPSNQINKPRFLTTLQAERLILNPWFITGLTDAEGCFTMSVGKNDKSKVGWAVKLSFQIGLHNKDRALLEQIQSYFKVGNISKHGSNMLHFRVESVKDLAKLINHFDKYPLITKKHAEYILFKKAYLIMLNKVHLTEDGLAKFVGIKASLNKGLSNTLNLAFPNIPVIDKLTRIDIKIPSPQWLVGFASGEGCFFIKIIKSINSRQGFSVQLIFQLTQHTRDEWLMRSLIDYLNSGIVFKNKETYVFQVTKFSDITEKFVPFFKDYPITGSKSEDFNDWLKVIELMKNKAHLTKEGLDIIRLIKAGMNRGRNLI
jgi:hypothetical protein